MDIINQISELFENQYLFAELCSNVDLSKKVTILNNYNDFYIQGFSYHSAEMEFSQDMSIQEIFCSLFVFDTYFCEEWDLNVKKSYEDYLECIIPEYLSQTNLGNHNIMLTPINVQKFIDEVAYYLPQVFKIKCAFKTYRFCGQIHYRQSKNYDYVIKHHSKIIDFFNKYQDFNMVLVFKEYLGNIFFGMNEHSAIYCVAEFID